MNLKANTYPEEVVRYIKYFVNYNVGDERVQMIADKAMLEPIPEKYIFDYAYDLLVYKPDEEYTQSIRTMDNMFYGRVGNCVSYSELIATLLSAAGIDYHIKIVSYTGPQDFEHVYIVTDKYVLDACIGQNPEGESRLLRPVNGKFNKEVKYKYSKKIDMPELNLLQGERKMTEIHTPLSRYEIRRYGVSGEKSSLQGFDFEDFFAEFDPFNPGSHAQDIFGNIDKALITPVANCAMGIITTYLSKGTMRTGCINQTTGQITDLGSYTPPSQKSASSYLLPLLLGGGVLYMLLSNNNSDENKKRRR